MSAFSRRSFLKGLGALALSAAASCRRAQEFAVEPEGCPEWMLPGEATCFATCLPWASGAIPLLAVCYDGVPVSLQPNPHYAGVRGGLPAFAQASLLDLYDPVRPSTPERGGRAFPWQGLRGAFRAWSRALRDGRRVGFLFPAGYSVLRAAQVKDLGQFSGASFYQWDPAADARQRLFPELEALQVSAFGPAVDFGWKVGSLPDLVKDLPSLDLLFIFTPADPAAFCPDFAHALRESKGETVRFVSRCADVTASLCLYTVPQTHFLEEWGADADAFGNVCLRQPVTLPLRPSLSEGEALHGLLHGALPDSSALSPVRDVLSSLLPGWEEGLRRGFVQKALPPPRLLPPAGRKDGVPAYYLHPFFADGRFLHNRWLGETFFPLSGYAGAPEVFLPGESHGAFSVRVAGRTLPAWRQPGLDFPCLPLLPGLSGIKAGDLSLSPAGPWAHHPVLKMPQQKRSKPEISPERSRWCLVVDLSRCIGCGACTLACRAENNIPLVGDEDLRYGRDLQWLHIKRCLRPDGSLLYVPSACRQCESAPCEAVCPVHATVRSSEGLNAMVYPRCWGTRYCAAACPYGARHFNFRDYAALQQRVSSLPANPQVTVRSRGVMEKCSFCAQRIHAAKARHAVPQTACQMACPAGAIRLLDLSRDPLPEQVNSSFDVGGTHPALLYL